MIEENVDLSVENRRTAERFVFFALRSLPSASDSVSY